MYVIVGVTGGIAAYKTVHLVRLLVKDGHQVHVVPTPDSLEFVGLATWEAISRHPVTSSVHADVASVRHVALGQQADLIVVAPATANTLAKLAAGIADNLLGTTVLASQAPVLVAPAMHTQMWLHPATQANLALLRQRGVHVIGPEPGELTGGDVGLGRMSEPDQIHTAIATLLTPDRSLAGVRLLVSLGGTQEPIDPVRYLGNRSSGKQGLAIVQDALRRGATVTAVAAHCAPEVEAALASSGAELVRVQTAAQLQDALTERAGQAAVIVMAAAVADYRVAEVSATKLTKQTNPDQLTLQLTTNPDIIAGLSRNRPAGQVVVGFSAQTEDDEVELLGRARSKRAAKQLDLLVLNRVGWDRGFEQSDNQVWLIDAADQVIGQHAGTKDEVAQRVLDAVSDLLADH